MIKNIIFILVFISTITIFIGLVDFDNNNNKGVKEYQQYCATCHGDNMQGGLGESLIDDKWQFGDDEKSIRQNIKNGILESGMPAFSDVLTDNQIDDLITFIKEKGGNYTVPKYDVVKEIETFDYKVKVELVTDKVDEPWAIDFISSTKALITEQPGALRIIENGKLLKDRVIGIPIVKYAGQGGLLDVAIDPSYSTNGWIYLAFSHDIDGKGMTKLVRGKLDGNNWVNEETVFQADEKFYVDTKYHYGSRIVFDDKGHLFFSIGDRGVRNHAQDLTRPNGKIHRIYKDGSIPKDNPFIGDENNFPTIYAFGNRNAQGLSFHPETGELWESEHGQKGGDELNIIQSGKNYGWDKITYGRNYDGTVSSQKVKMEGMEVPILFWRPSIAVCGIDFYKGDLFPRWKNHLIVGALKFEEVRLLDIEDNRVLHQETIIKDAGRVRDVSSAPDGSIYIVLNNPDEILRLVPKD